MSSQSYWCARNSTVVNTLAMHKEAPGRLPHCCVHGVMVTGRAAGAFAFVHNGDLGAGLALGRCACKLLDTGIT
jgi:hypothetical protein